MLAVHYLIKAGRFFPATHGSEKWEKYWRLAGGLNKLG
jgi:hypothetical protein